MKICEVCGIEEENENGADEVMQTGLLHICENCRNDRKIHSVESHGFDE